jgi:hypothetical protein
VKERPENEEHSLRGLTNEGLAKLNPIIKRTYEKLLGMEV